MSRQSPEEMNARRRMTATVAIMAAILRTGDADRTASDADLAKQAADLYNAVWEETR